MQTLSNKKEIKDFIGALNKDEVALRAQNALNLILQFKGVASGESDINYQLAYEAQYKDWILDQLARELTGDHYEEFVSFFRAGDEGSTTYGYNEGEVPEMSFDKTEDMTNLIKDISHEADVKDIEKALEDVYMYGGIDGAHHKDRAIDQVTRKLAGNKYNDLVHLTENVFVRDKGIAP